MEVVNVVVNMDYYKQWKLWMTLIFELYVATNIQQLATIRCDCVYECACACACNDDLVVESKT